MKTVYQNAFLNAQKYLKVSLTNFASKLETNKAFISRVENNKQKPSLKLIQKLEELTGFSFWALAAGDFKAENQYKYLRLKKSELIRSKTDFSKLSTNDRHFLYNKFSVEIEALLKKQKRLEQKLIATLEKRNFSKTALKASELALQKAQSNLDFLNSNNAPTHLIVEQEAKLKEIQNRLEEVKEKASTANEQKIILAQIQIEEIELKIRLRQEKNALLEG